MLYLLNRKKIVGVPKIIEFIQCKGFNYLVMQLLGPNLDQLRQALPAKTFSLKTICMIGYAII